MKKPLSQVPITAYYFFCYLTFGVIKSPLSKDLGQRLFYLRSLVLPYTKIQFVMNCLLVLPFPKLLGHYLPRQCTLSGDERTCNTDIPKRLHSTIRDAALSMFC